MHLVVAGASGGTGSILVERALASGHEVTALVRSPERVTARGGGLRVVRADLVGEGPIDGFPDGADAVVSALGLSDRRDRTPVCFRGTTRLLDEMRSHWCSRLLVLSAAPVLRSGGGESIVERMTVLPLVRLIYRRNYADLERMERLLEEQEDIDWTILRPGRLLDGPAVGSVRTELDRNVSGELVRADLADAILAILNRPETIRRGVGVGPA